MSHLHQINSLHNHYFALRHGQSKANVMEIVLSDLHDGQLEEYTLTEEGERQVTESISKAKEGNVLGADTLIISSPFSRARRTAEIAHEVLGCSQQVILDERLRERWFGDFEKKPNTSYNDVWVEDKDDPQHTKFNVESAESVQKRTTELIKELEERYSGKNIILVSHGDALQILQTGFAKVSPAVHRELEHLNTAELRKLDLKN